MAGARYGMICLVLVTQRLVRECMVFMWCYSVSLFVVQLCFAMM